MLNFTRLLLLLLLVTSGISCGESARLSMRTLGDIREVLGTPSGAGAAVLVQASECVSREADLRLIREVLAPASVGLLSSNGRQPEEELRSLVRGLFQLSDSSLTELPDATAPLLRDVGVKSTPVLVVWNDAASVFLVASISPNRRILRQQLIAAQILLQMRE